jgi:hypothetical protein
MTMTAGFSLSSTAATAYQVSTNARVLPCGREGAGDIKIKANTALQANATRRMIRGATERDAFEKMFACITFP